MARRRHSAGTSLLLSLLAGAGALLPACATEDVQQATPVLAGSALEARRMLGEVEAAREADERPILRPRSLGMVTARVPGTSTDVDGVRLAAHRVRITIEGDYARTEIEEELANDTARVLEGRYVFALPSEASVSRLVLWVDGAPVEGEMVERGRARSIFQGIVDDTVRPRDPALLESARGGELRLRIFPMPAHGRRKVLVTYDQALSATGSQVGYTLPLGLGAERATHIDEMTIDVSAAGADLSLEKVTVKGLPLALHAEEGRLSGHLEQQAFAPTSDLTLRWPRPARAEIPLDVRASGGERFFGLRLPIQAQAGAHAGPRQRVLVIDGGHGQSRESFAQATALTEGVVARLGGEDRFAVLVCDSACAAFPEKGLAAPGEEVIRGLDRFLQAHTPGGATDMAGAIEEATRRLDVGARGQVVWMGDGAPSAGELSAATVAARVGPALAARGAELRMLGVGRSLKEALLGEVAARVSAAYERVSTGEPLGGRIAAIAARIDAPLITGARLVLPRGFVAAEPHALPGLVAGQEIFVVGKLEEGAGAGEVALEGTLAGAPVTLRWPLAKAEEGRLPVLPRRWAEARIAELSAAGDPASTNEIVALSQKYHVLSDRTALLVLENDRMFAAFGIPRTAGGDQPSNPGGVAPGASDPAAPAAGLGSSGSGQGFGSGGLSLGGDHKTSVPQVRMGATTVSGRLPPEVIQRIVRQQFGRFRLCYEKGLLSNPTLSGRVVVQFGIGSSGEVTAARNGGSDLPDNGVVQCVVRAFQGISFPAPEGGTVTVRYPILFSPDGGAPPRRSFAPRATEPSATHLAGDEAWRTQGEEALAKLRKALAEDPSRRQRHEALLRALLGRGRFEEALAAARSYAALDPDGAQAQELLSSAAAASGERRTALVALDTLASLAPRDARAHERAARAFEATGDERRACAHWRSRAELLPGSEDALLESRRCRARVLGEREAVLGEVHGMERPGEKMKALAAALATGEAAAHVEPQSGAFQASLGCDGEGAQCPWLAVLLPDGTVLSPATPGRGSTGGAWVSLAYASGGTYRTLAVGGAPGITATVEVRAYGTTRKVALPPGDGVRTAIVTTVEEPGFGSGAGILH